MSSVYLGKDLELLAKGLVWKNYLKVEIKSMVIFNKGF